jgi:hypothetical protein
MIAVAQLNCGRLDSENSELSCSQGVVLQQLCREHVPRLWVQQLRLALQKTPTAAARNNIIMSQSSIIHATTA